MWTLNDAMTLLHDDSLSWLKTMQCRVDAWHEPLVNVDDNFGEVVLEWWAPSPSDRKITVYYESPTSIEYMKIGGPKGYNNIDVGHITSVPDFQELWEWLHTT